MNTYARLYITAHGSPLLLSAHLLDTRFEMAPPPDTLISLFPST